MKKRLMIAAQAAVVLIGIALVVVDFSVRLSPRAEILIACAYAISGFGILSALKFDQRSVPIAVLYGLAFAAFGLTDALMMVLFPGIVMLYHEIFGTNEEEEEPAAEIGLPPGCGILLKDTDELYYQLLRGRDRLFLVSLGSRYFKLTPQRAIRAEGDFAREQNDRVMRTGDIRAIRILLDGSLRIRGRHGGRFEIQPPTAIDEAATYLAGLKVDVEQPVEPRFSPETARIIDNVNFVISVAGGLFGAAWMYFDAPYNLLAGLNIAIPVIAFALFCLFYDAAAPDAKEKKGSIATIGCLIPLLPLMHHSRHDFNFVSYGQFVLPCAICAGCALILTLVASRSRKRIGASLILSMIVTLGVAVFAAFSVGPINYILDDGARVSWRTAEVLYLNMIDDESMPTESCTLLLEEDGDSVTLKVSRKTYDAVERGDEVRILTHTGPLGISYSEVVPDN